MPITHKERVAYVDNLILERTQQQEKYEETRLKQKARQEAITKECKEACEEIMAPTIQMCNQIIKVLERDNGKAK